MRTKEKKRDLGKENERKLMKVGFKEGEKWENSEDCEKGNMERRRYSEEKETTWVA